MGAGKAAPQVPLVVLSGHDDEALALRAVKSGAQDYLIKCRADGAQISRSIRHAIERKRGELEMTHQALHDPLTGVPNRVLFLDRLSLALHRSERRDSYAAVLFVDLDRFTTVNDSLGHEAGDLVLQAVAARLTKGCARAIRLRVSAETSSRCCARRWEARATPWSSRRDCLRP